MSWLERCPHSWVSLYQYIQLIKHTLCASSGTINMQLCIFPPSYVTNPHYMLASQPGMFSESIPSLNRLLCQLVCGPINTLCASVHFELANSSHHNLFIYNSVFAWFNKMRGQVSIVCIQKVIWHNVWAIYLIIRFLFGVNLIFDLCRYFLYSCTLSIEKLRSF